MTISKREGLSFVQYESDGVNQNFPFSFTYLDRDFIFVRVGSVLTTDFTFVNSNEIRLNTAAPSGVIVTISRITEGEEKLVDFQDSGIITEKLLDTEFDQVMNLVQEAKDVANSSVFIDIDTMTGDAGFARLINVADAVDPQDAMNKRTTEAMFQDFSDEFNGKLVEIQDIEDNVENIALNINGINTDLTTKYNQVVTMSNTMTTQLSQAQDAKDDAVLAKIAAEDARDATALSASQAEGYRDQAQDIADSLGPIATEFPAVKDSVDQLEIDVGELQVDVSQLTSAVSDIIDDVSTLETQMTDTVRLTSVQTVTNKTLAGSSIVNPTRTDVKSDTYNNLVTYATTATDGQTVFAYDIGKFYGVVGNQLKDLGGGGGGSLDTVKQFNATESLTDWSTVMTTSTFVKTTTDPLHGNESYLFTTGASEVAIVNTPQIPVDLKFRGKLIAFKIPYLCSTASKFSMSIWDTTSTAVQLGSDSVFEAETVNVKFLTKIVYVPQGCTQVKVQIVANTGTAGHTLKFDDIDIGSNLTEAIVAKFDNTTGRVRVGNLTSHIRGETTNPTFGTLTQNDVFVTRNGSQAMVEYRLTQTSAGTQGNGRYIFKLPIINGVQLKFDMSGAFSGGTVGSRVTQSGVGYYFFGGNYRIENDTEFTVQGQAYNNNTGNIVSACVFSSSCFGFNSNEYFLNFKLAISVPEWSSQTNAAIVACKEGPLKCTNTYTAKITGSTNAVSNYNTPTPWMSCANGANLGIKSCTYIGLNLNNRMNCIIEIDTATGAPSNPVAQVTYSTNTGLVTNTVPNNVYTDFTLTCTKTGADYNEAYERIVIQKDDADIRSTEWLTGGFDYISNKPIYKKCGKVNSDIGVTSGTTILTTSANVIPLGHWYYNSTASLYYSVLERTTSNSGLLRFAPTTGILSYFSDAGTYQLKAGQIICLEYLKP